MPWSQGGIGVNLLHRSLRGEADETLIGLFASWRISDRFQLQAYARHAILGERRTSFGAHLSVALGGRQSASASIDGSRREQAATLSYQNDPPAGLGGGYRVNARLGEAGGAEATYIRNFPLATVTAQASHARGATGLRASAAGAIGLVGGRAFASRSLGESFATVRVPGFPGVRVYADNQPVGVTDRAGYVVVPGLRAFERNAIRIEQGDLPLDVTLESEEIAVRPFARSGSSIAFHVRRERGALLRVRLEDGGALPAGALVRVEGNAAVHVAVSGGEVYIPNLAGAVRLRAAWTGGSCEFIAYVPDNDDPQPRLDNLVCARSPDYATR
jgi:outer membrane usher protein